LSPHLLTSLDSDGPSLASYTTVEKGNLPAAAAAISTTPEFASAHATAAESIAPSEDEASDSAEDKGSAEPVAPVVGCKISRKENSPSFDFFRAPLFLFPRIHPRLTR